MEAELANQPGAQRKRKIDDVEPEDETKENNNAESKVEEKAEPATSDSSKPEVDADLPDVDMNVEPKVGPIDEERPYKKASRIGNNECVCSLWANQYTHTVDWFQKQDLPCTFNHGMQRSTCFLWVTNNGSNDRLAICLSAEFARNTVLTLHVVKWLSAKISYKDNNLNGHWPSVTYQKIFLVSKWVSTDQVTHAFLFINARTWFKQICGARPDQVARACEVINDEIDVDFVDLNMGCPIDLVFNTVSV